MTFGFQSAVDIATNAIDCIHTTASSHGRVFIVEIMGHKGGLADAAQPVLRAEPISSCFRRSPMIWTLW